MSARPELTLIPPPLKTVKLFAVLDIRLRSAPSPTLVLETVPPPDTVSIESTAAPEMLANPLIRPPDVWPPLSTTTWPPLATVKPSAMPPRTLRTPPAPTVVLVATLPEDKVSNELATAPDTFEKPAIVPLDTWPPEPTRTCPPLTML